MSDFNRARLLPAGNALGWTPYAWLVYLPALFVEPALRHTSAAGWALLAAGAAIFLASYFRAHWVRGRELRVHVVLQAALGAAFTPTSAGACVFFTFAAAAGARVERAREAMAWVLGVSAAAMCIGFASHAPIQYWLGYGVFTALVGGVSLQRAQADRASERLRVANEEIERLAAIAERERIARDLHDVLGHTLSLIVLKSQLASRLAERDPARAASEIRDVEDVARKALNEVRDTIRGYRARLAEELRRASQLLDAGGISLVVDSSIAADDFDGHEHAEEALALAVREAATNIARHSHARRASIRVWRDAASESFRIEVADDGVGATGSAPGQGAGTGLRGMRARIEELTGTLTIDATSVGTRLVAAIPSGARTQPDAPLRVVHG